LRRAAVFIAFQKVIIHPWKDSTMNNYTHQTAPTQFVEANGIRFAYRRFGKPVGSPLVFNMHFTGTMVAGAVFAHMPYQMRVTFRSCSI
jgi:hypothetical protein